MDPFGAPQAPQPLERPRKIAVKKVKEEVKKEDEPIHPYFVVPSWKQDEKLWELPLDVEPLLNVFTFGWTEDGRCGYPPPHPSHIQMHPHPVYELRQPINRKTGKHCGVFVSNPPYHTITHVSSIFSHTTLCRRTICLSCHLCREQTFNFYHDEYST